MLGGFVATKSSEFLARTYGNFMVHPHLYWLRHPVLEIWLHQMKLNKDFATKTHTSSIKWPMNSENGVPQRAMWRFPKMGVPLQSTTILGKPQQCSVFWESRKHHPIHSHTRCLLAGEGHIKLSSEETFATNLGQGNLQALITCSGNCEVGKIYPPDPTTNHMFLTPEMIV